MFRNNEIELQVESDEWVRVILTHKFEEENYVSFRIPEFMSFANMVNEALVEARRVMGMTVEKTTRDEKNPRDLTLRELQTQLPWTIHYHHDFRASPMAHKDFDHALLHVMKAVGKLAAVVNDAEHGGSDFKSGDVDPYIADLVVCALRMANTVPGRTLDLQNAVEKRIEMKNNVTLVR
jgi:hypothetical protein